MALDITGSFKVGSWLISIDTLNREQLLKTCMGWEDEHTALLLEEIAARTHGESILDIDLVRTDISKLTTAAGALSKYRDCPCSALTVGLLLVE